MTQIHCCQCDGKVEARLTSGEEVYPHRTDLWYRSFYACTQCGNYVGVHKDSGQPLGSIPTPELRRARSRLHRVIDPIWKGGKAKRKDIYQAISAHIGRKFHSAETRSVQEVEAIEAFVRSTYWTD